jgi:hypothetical protein
MIPVWKGKELAPGLVEAVLAEDKRSRLPEQAGATAGTASRRERE